MVTLRRTRLSEACGGTGELKERKNTKTCNIFRHFDISSYGTVITAELAPDGASLNSTNAGADVYPDRTLFAIEVLITACFD